MVFRVRKATRKDDPSVSCFVFVDIPPDSRGLFLIWFPEDGRIETVTANDFEIDYQRKFGWSSGEIHETSESGREIIHQRPAGMDESFFIKDRMHQNLVRDAKG